jgi:uncharacterized damage-inducible protein DinB
MDAAQARFLVATLTGVLENEFKTTCKVLGAVKDDNKNYKPDEKSRSAWELATHIATSDVWFLDSIIQGKFNFDPEAAKKAESQFASVSDVVAFYQKAFPAKLAELRALSDENLTRTVDFFGMMKMPAAAFLPLANNHGIHHRGQLAAYLRPMGSKVPAIYGGSADEPMR